MKKIIFALFALISFYMVSWSITSLSTIDQITSVDFLFEKGGLSVVNFLPQSDEEELPFFSILQKQATLHHVNLYMSEAEDIFYQETPFTQEFTLIIGDEEPINDLCGNLDTVCELPTIQKDNTIRLQKLDQKEEVAHSFYVAGEPQNIQDFITAISKNVSKNSVSSSDESEMKVDRASMSQGIAFFMQPSIWIITLALLLSNVLYFVTQTKVFMVKQLHGYSVLRIYAEEMYAIIKWMGCIIAIGLVGSCGYLLILQQYTLSALPMNVMMMLLLNLLFIICYLLLSFPFLCLCCRQNMKEALKNRQHTKAASIAVLFCKVILISICIVECCSFLYNFRKAIPNIKHQDAYEVMSEGYTNYQVQKRWNLADGTTDYQGKVFKAFERQLDTAYVFDQIQLSGNKVVPLFEDFGYTVNKSFLNRLELKDEQGKVIDLSEKDIDEYLFVSSSLKQQQQQLSILDNPVQARNVIYLQEGQSIFLFDMQDKRYADATTEDFILYTSSNIRALNSYYVHVKATPEKMKEVLKLEGLPDYLNYESLTEYSNREVDRWMKIAMNNVVDFILYLIFIVVFISCDIKFYGKSHWKEISVKQLMGYGSLRLHRKKLIQEGVLILCQCILSYLLIYVAHMNGFYRNDYLTIFITIVLIDFVFLLVGLSLRNRHSLQSNLKKQ